ncbi:hypothetical protein FD723_01040 [Nostoc sp. C052]|uniref:hypothetical protein n=1 Tax=Nostoc sp. C052 TaxID=2576902 RepID=UPI0015C35719|nr:hypothetical protein [Nostoc sp. C052]QLE39233.1 hypothetical protein FD723_01040 [Nostoc sp. C052]
MEQEAAEEDISLEKVLLIESLLDNVDFKMLNTGAILTAAAVGEMQSQISQIPVNLLSGNYNYSINTLQGRIILSAKGDQVYSNTA